MSAETPQRLKRKLATAGLYGVITIVSAAVAFAGFEVYTRSQLVKRYNESDQGLPLIIQNQPLHIAEVDALFDRKVRIDPEGFYFKVNETFATGLVATNGHVQEYVVRTNSLGYLSDRSYRTERDPAAPEYRIAVLGDSMTGTTTMSRQWVDTLEDLLNDRAVLRKAVGGKTFKTINLGWPGAGFEAFLKAYLEKAKKFSPDMVIVNFIELDFVRTTAGPHMTDMDEAVAKAERCLREIVGDHGNVIVTFMPMYGEMFPDLPARMPVLTEQLRKRVAPIEVIDLRKLMPTQVGAEKAKQWYNFPNDSHMSDLGGELYARAMASVISERLAGTRIDFRKAPSRFFSAETMDQPVQNGKQAYTLKILNQPEKLRALRRAISTRYLETKTSRTAHFYSLDRFKGMKQNFFQVPPGIPVQGGFEKITYGDGQKDYGYLNVICKTPPITIDNPACYQFFYVMVKD
jgi:lysophospholipase L1-like esterase